MSSLLQRYHDISPVTLQLVGGAVTSSLYCEEVEGLAEGAGPLAEGAGPLVESFLVELFRCKLCQFTCGLNSAIYSHLLLAHRPPALTYVVGANDGEGAESGAEMRLQQGASPYQLDLKGESKPSDDDDDEDFLLYRMLDNMSPPTCDISTEAGLQVGHTCEVSTLFEEDESIFCLKGTSVDLSCPIDSASSPIDSASTQEEELAQSAHLMTLGLCRISSTRPPPPPPPPPPPLSSSSPAPPPEDSAHPSCRLCPVTLASRHLLDVHTRSHRAEGGFSCVRCSWTAHSWAELEPHWRSHCRRRGRSKKRRRSEGTARASCSVTAADRRRGLIGRAEGKEAEQTFRQAPGIQSDATVLAGSRPQRTLLQSHAHKTRRKKKNKEEKKEVERTGFCCTLCQRKFSSQLTLRRHMGVHSEDKPFSCPHCPYCSRLKASLRQHLRTHTGEKPYRCCVCSYASIDLSSLLRHKRTHSQEKPYRCEVCDYCSIQKKSLDLHTRRHHTGV